MRPDLRDSFAIHFAAALAREQRYSIEFIVGRAYDLAEAMIEERERRLDADAHAVHDGAFAAHDEGLLDDVAPPSDADPAYASNDELLLDPSWLDPPYDPAWDSEKWRLEPTQPSEPAADSSRPGLARTQAERDEQARRRRLA